MDCSFCSYLALGLAHDLNPISSGGSEVTLSHTIDQINTSQPCPTSSSSTIDDAQPSASDRPIAISALPKGFGRIIRDSAGNVIRVELPSNEEAGDAPKRELEIDPPVATMESELRIWARDRSESWKETGPGAESSVVQGQFPICIESCSTGILDPRLPRGQWRVLPGSHLTWEYFSN